MKKVFIIPTSCEKRALDAKKIFVYLSKNGYEIVDQPKDADIIIFVTCAFNEEKAERALKQVKFLQNYNAELIIAGCLPAIESKRLSGIFDGKKIDTKSLDKIDDLFPENKIKFSSIDDANIRFQSLDVDILRGPLKRIFIKSTCLKNIYLKIRNHVLKNLVGEHSSAYKGSIKTQFHIRISWGCMGNCSYCAIKKAVGPFHSKPLDQCIREFKNGLALGYKDFIIAADDIGSYGLDISSSLPELLDKMTAIPGNYKLAIKDLHPRWVVKYIDDLEKIFKRYKIIHLDIPIQSTSSRILKLMHRYSDVEKVKETTLRLKKACPDIVINTTYLLGFPTETEDEMKQTLSFIKEVDFNEGTVFRFSCKTGTEAENIEPKISDEELYKRMIYAKKYIRKSGYKIIYKSKTHFFTFNKKNNK